MQPADGNPAPNEGQKAPEISKEDELERLRKENERLKEINRLREENERLKQSVQGGASPKGVKQFRLNKNVYMYGGFVAVIIVALLLLVFVFHIFNIVPSSTTLQPTVNAGASGKFFVGPDGQPLGSAFIAGLSDLSTQLQQVGSEELAGRIVNESYGCLSSSTGQFIANATKCNSNQGYSPSPAYSVLEYGNGSGTYNIIPLKVPSDFSNISLVQGGKPTIVYFGAQGCPFCAQMRWILAVALSRFGNFSQLFYDRSATNDWNVPTFMFNFSSKLFDESTAQPAISNGQAPYGDNNPTPLVSGAYYTSKYINFEPFDEMGGSFLVNVTGIEQLSPFAYSEVYLPSGNGFNVTNPSAMTADGFGITNFFLGGVPFFDINNQFVFDGAIDNAGTILDTSTGTVFPQYSSQQDILNSLENPVQGSFGQTVLGGANILTAQICETINNTAPVCSLTYIKGLEKMISSAV
ncbi:MAG: DUF929 family protein [Candidatus Parvarchaeota archaeon]|nr:DUF929 family protein [Candidatus Parvarchaeota archaeon]MCW1301736.1 DUF929 family protein [Candidatus Parvarchaeota archaeon]